MKYRKNAFAAMGIVLSMTMATNVMGASTVSGLQKETSVVQSQMPSSAAVTPAPSAAPSPAAVTPAPSAAPSPAAVTPAPSAVPSPAAAAVPELKEVQTFEWQQNGDSWELKLNGAQTSDGIYKVKEQYYFIKDGVLLTGEQDVVIPDSLSAELTEGNGAYYFSEKGQNPDEGLGAMVSGNKWTETSDSRWIYVGEKGKIDKTKKGIVDIDGRIFMLDADGKKMTGLVSDGTDTYYFDPETCEQVKGPLWIQMDDGQLIYLDDSNKVVESSETGWQTINEKKYYLEAGKPVKGWKLIDSEWYYFDRSSGAMQTGWMEEGITWYYFNAEGVMQTGWQNLSGSWFYMNGSGAMVKGWQVIDGQWYYMNGSGVMLFGWQLIDGKWYYMNNSGAMTTGWQLVYGRWFYMNASGAMETGWKYIDNKWYYLEADGAMAVGWRCLNGSWFYMDGSGAMRTGWVYVDNKWYYTNRDGVMLFGWQIIDGKWYYMNGSGAMVTDWLYVNGQWYYMSGSGAMVTGWLYNNSRWYYMNGSGAMLTGWINVDGKYYYMNGSGAMLTGWFLADGQWYYANGKGEMLTGWINVDGKKYHMKSSGAMDTGWTYIDGYKFFFNASGHLLEDLDGVLPKQSSYYITINRSKCQVMVYAKDGTNGYIIPVKTFACSVGMPDTPTAEGTYHTQDKHRWKLLMGPSWGQYATRIYGGVLFHSVAGGEQSSYNINPAEYNKLGSPASHGCVRLNVRDAKWIYDNCVSGTTVTISDGAATPFDKPATIKLPAWQNWDPTDPAIQ